MKRKFLICTAAAVLLVFSCKQNDSLLSPEGTQSFHENSAALTASSVSDYGTYTISCVAGGKFIEVSGYPTYNEKFDDQRKLQQWQASISGTGDIDRWQKWQIIYKTTAGGIKYYHIRNLHSGKLMDVPSGSSQSGLQLQQYAEFLLPADEQLWKIEEVGTSGQYKIINKGNGLAVTNENASTANGTKITQETDVSANKQKWILTPIPADSYRDDAVVRFFNRNSTSQGSVAFDEGTSVPLTWSSNNGKVLWITQDAWDGSSLQANQMFNCNAFFSYGNSVLIQPSTSNWNNSATVNMTIANSAQNKPKQIFDIQPNNTFAWPGPGVEIGNKVYIQCGEGSVLSLSNQSLYILTESSGTQWTTQRTTPAGMSGQNAINYATGMVKASDGYVYAFGSQSTGFGYSSNIHVARFPVSNPQSWTFWNGSGWTNSPTTGTTARVAEGLGSSAVSYVNGKYVLMTMDQGFNCDASRNIYIATATSPTGPFTTRKLVYTINEYFFGQYARYYTPSIHPEFNNGRNELLVTYCLNYSACGVNSCQNGYMDPYYYRVKGVRIPYSVIGL